ncbi:ABC-2 type transport system permease protein [Balneicella halophila]|uniref:ABC-2 type transport system permease protein n=1 Tax=Balneicella halophila TaxID=1537566 RepID=A0A7L4US89_BALHA|nr:ABC transporter permease [Balneicella halophila]PVX52645.1 ABC-2 type transport system permease protein [Balneicella halophila]
MNKIAIIIGREYFVRVKQKMFLLVTFGAPLLFIGLYAFFFYIMMKEDTTERTIAVINKSELKKPLHSDETTTFEYVDKDALYKDLLEDEKYYAVLELPTDIENTAKGQLYSNKQVPAEVSSDMSNILSDIIRQRKIDKLTNDLQIPELEEKIEATKTKVHLTSVRLKDGEEKKSSSMAATILSVLALGVGFMIFFLVITYGGIVMKGVVEEKSNRIVEVIVSSVKPFQLMIGKIVGIALVGLTQILIWGVLLGIISIVSLYIFGASEMTQMQDMAQQGQQMTQEIGSDINDVIHEAIASIEPGMIIKLIVVGFIYTLLGYVLYASFYAAIGAAADNETDTQQLSLPVTIPLLAAFYIAFNVARNPESSLAFWASIIPFTSPVVMPVRIPFDVPWWELLLSLAILIITIIACIMLAAKIYRIGILMYGKKVNWKELVKWVKYKN